MTGVQTCALPIYKLDLNRGILTPHLSVGTHSRSTYISDLISVQDKVLETAVQALLKRRMLKTPRHQNQRLCSPWGHMSYADTLIDLQLDYTLSGMALTVLSPLRGPSMLSRILSITRNEVFTSKI